MAESLLGYTFLWRCIYKGSRVLSCRSRKRVIKFLKWFDFATLNLPIAKIIRGSEITEELVIIFGSITKSYPFDKLFSTVPLIGDIKIIDQPSFKVWSQKFSSRSRSTSVTTEDFYCTVTAVVLQNEAVASTLQPECFSISDYDKKIVLALW